MLQEYMHLVSVDDHLIEPEHLWHDRLPMKFRESGPRVITLDEPTVLPAATGELRLPPGAQVWQYEGRRYATLGLAATAGKEPQDWGTDPYRYEEMRPGFYEPRARVADMESDGIQAMLLFPTFPRFAGTRFLDGKDKELALLSVQAWNDHVLEEWYGPNPDRFIPMALIPLWDVERSVKEIERVAALGARCIAFPENPAPLGLPTWTSGHWDPVCAAAQAHELPLCMHFGTSGVDVRPSVDSNFLSVNTLLWLNSVTTTAELLFSPIFHRFPRLKVVLSESGIGWVPALLERAELAWERHRYYNPTYGDLTPTELFRRNMFSCYIVDKVGLQHRHDIGVDNILWECDYPHSDSHWPHARKRASEQLVNIPDEEAHRIVELNARELFHFPRHD